MEGTFWDKFWRPIRSRALLFTPDYDSYGKNRAPFWPLFGRRILGQHPAAPSSPCPFVLLLILGKGKGTFKGTFQARKQSTKINFLCLETAGSSTRRGSGRKVRALPRKFVFLGFRREESAMSGEFCRDVPDPEGCSKSLRKKSSCAFFVPYLGRSGPEASGQSPTGCVWFFFSPGSGVSKKSIKVPRECPRSVKRCPRHFRTLSKQYVWLDTQERRAQRPWHRFRGHSQGHSPGYFARETPAAGLRQAQSTRTAKFDPTSGSTSVPTSGPTKTPTRAPTRVPMRVPTNIHFPVLALRGLPTKVPTKRPTRVSTEVPTKVSTKAVSFHMSCFHMFCSLPKAWGGSQG